MIMAQNFLTTAAIICVFNMTGVAEAATPQPSSPDSNTAVIEVSGEVPGFTQPQLTAYLVREMQLVAPAPWHFVAGEPGEEPRPNRIVWSFKILRTVWKGSSHMGFPSPTYSESYLVAEAKLYLNGAYEMTIDTHPSVSNALNDKVLSEMAHDTVHALFVENKPNMP